MPGPSISGTTVMYRSAAYADDLRVVGLGVVAALAAADLGAPAVLARRGQPSIAMRQPWSSLRCRCRVLIL